MSNTKRVSIPIVLLLEVKKAWAERNPTQNPDDWQCYEIITFALQDYVLSSYQNQNQNQNENKEVK